MIIAAPNERDTNVFVYIYEDDAFAERHIRELAEAEAARAARVDAELTSILAGSLERGPSAERWWSGE